MIENRVFPQEHNNTCNIILQNVYVTVAKLKYWYSERKLFCSGIQKFSEMHKSENNSVELSEYNSVVCSIWLLECQNFLPRHALSFLHNNILMSN